MGRLFCLLLLPFLTYGFVIEWLKLLTHFQPTLAWRYFTFGGCLFALSWCVYRERMSFFLTLEHELTHAIAGMLCFKAPTSLSVASNGGEVSLTGSNWFIQLAPYFLPPFQYVALGLTAIISPSHRSFGMLVLGATTAFHIFSTMKETNFGQPDIQRAGPIFSMLVIPVGNLIFVGGILAFVSGCFPNYWMRGLETALSLGLQLSQLALNAALTQQ